MFSRYQNIIPYQNLVLINGTNATNNFIIETIHKNLPDAIRQTKKIAHNYAAPTIQQTCAKIFADLQKIPYIADKEPYQDIKLPSALLLFGGDCKSMALFAAAILCNLEIRNGLDYASYDTTTIPSHVYNFAVLQDGSEYPIDRVFCTAPGTEIPYNHKKKFYMIVRTIAGNGNATINGLSLKGLVNTVKQAATTVADGIKQVVPDKIENAVNNAVKTVVNAGATVSLFIPRKAVLGLIALNVRFLATKLREMIDKGGEQRLRNTWANLGGDYTELVGTINSGIKNKGVFGLRDGGIDNQLLLLEFQKRGGNLTRLYKEFNKTGSIQMGIAGEPVSTAALIASATPVLIALIAALNKDGISVPEAAELAAKGAEAYTTMTGTPVNQTLFTLGDSAGKVSQALNPTGAPPAPMLPGSGVKPPVQQPAGGTNASMGPGREGGTSTGAYVNSSGEVVNNTGGGGSSGNEGKSNTMLYIGIAAVALIFILKK